MGRSINRWSGRSVGRLVGRSEGLDELRMDSVWILGGFYVDSGWILNESWVDSVWIMGGFWVRHLRHRFYMLYGIWALFVSSRDSSAGRMSS